MKNKKTTNKSKKIKNEESSEFKPPKLPIELRITTTLNTLKLNMHSAIQEMKAQHHEHLHRTLLRVERIETDIFNLSKSINRLQESIDELLTKREKRKISRNNEK